jgi:aromatic ring-cleaving dioxygenase
MPTSFESLLRHRASHADAPESKRVWFFHSHAYFDHESLEGVAEARAFMALASRTFASTPHVEVHSLVPRPAGPHPRGSFEVLFTREAFADYVSWLMFERPSRISVVIHPLTRSQTLDHTSRALWLGERLAMSCDVLEAADARALADERNEAEIIERTKKH